MNSTHVSNRTVRVAAPLALIVAAVFSAHCGGAAPESAAGTTGEEAMSKTVHTVYGVTTFGGPGDYQQMACGGNSRNAGDWYVASSQRYGCNKHLMLTANGRCAVARTADAGPASYVESGAGIAVLDSSPAIGRYFFGESSLGYSDIRANPGKYEVHVSVTSLPLGPCDGSSSSGGSSGTSSGGSSGTSTSSSGGSSSGGSSGTSTSSGSGGSSSGGGASCASDGDCNPGNDGSGLICAGGACVPGCHHDNQCPGSQTCVSGNCQ